MDSFTTQTPPDLSSGRGEGVTRATEAERRGPFAPRLLLLTAIVYHPTILIAYLLYLNGPGKACVVGTLCAFGSYSAPLQVLLLLAGCGLLLLATYILVYRLIAAPDGGSVANFLRDLTAYPLIAPLLRIYGFVILAGLLLAVLARHLTIPALVVGSFGALVCFYCASAGARLMAPPGSGGRT